jgi:hypothetical protein
MIDSIQPVILCGGSGSRLWPLSRSGFPKPRDVSVFSGVYDEEPPDTLRMYR